MNSWINVQWIKHLIKTTRKHTEKVNQHLLLAGIYMIVQDSGEPCFRHKYSNREESIEWPFS